MKKLILLFTIFLVMLVFCGCTTDKAAILFNKYPITEKNIYDYAKSFPSAVSDWREETNSM